jgi:hypothetical protein
MHDRRSVATTGSRVVATALVALAVAQVAVAAPDAGAKAHGNFNFYGASVHHAFTSARGHVDAYQQYLSEAHGVALPAAEAAAGEAAVAAPVAADGPVDAVIAREASDAIAADIQRIQRHVNQMRADAADRGDTAALAKLADVDRQLGVARRAHAALHEHHAGETIAPATAMQLAQQVNTALRAAHAEHDELLADRGGRSGP